MAGSPVIKVDDLVVEYASAKGAVRAVNSVSFEVHAGEIFTLLGPSGCGKTTTLRSVAGLETPVSGEISLAGRSVFSSATGVNVAPHDRRLGMVFQSYAVWPHMSVLANVAYPLRYGRNKLSDTKQAKAKALRALERVQLEAMANRNATELSGGQQQRVALARALVTDPEVLLLDEPLSNLDALLRADMRVEMEELVRSLGTTALYVTHDQTEALSMSDQVGVMRGGEIVECAAPRQLYDKPSSLFAGSFLGTMNLIKGQVTQIGSDGTSAEITTDLGHVIRAVACGDLIGLSDAVEVGIRPENVSIRTTASDTTDSTLTTVKATMRSSSFVGDQVIVLVRVGDADWHVQLRPSDPVPAIGEELLLTVPHELCFAFVSGS